MKKCTKCLLNKNEESFYKDKKGKDGLSYFCSDCIRLKTKLYTILKPLKKKESDRNYRINNIEKCKEYWVAYNKNNKDSIKERKDKWHKENNEHHKEYCKKYRQDNKEQINLMKRDWYNRNPEVYKCTQLRYNSRKKGADDGTINKESVDKILQLQQFLCNHCNKDIKEKNTRQLDHIKPLSLGGLNSIKNVQWLCSFCNQSKGNRFIG